MMPREKAGTRGVVCGSHPAVKAELARRMRREMTPAEARLWDVLRQSKLAGLHFRRQQVIEGFIADFYCHEAGLVVELDGAIHDNQQEYDAERDRIMRTRGLRILRIPNSRVFSGLDAVLAEIATAAKQG